MSTKGSADRLNENERQVRFLELHRPFSFQAPFDGEEFVLLIVANRDDVAPDERARLSDEIVRQKCRYAVCLGEGSSSWDDAIDEAYLETVGFEPQDQGFVMTSWHEDGNLEDVVNFFLTCTSFDDFRPQRFLVLLLTDHVERKAAVRRMVHELASELF